MIKEAIGRGATVEEATEDAKLQLGAKDDEDLQIDIVALPKKKVMGIFGGSQAEVKVSVERPDEKPAKQQKSKPQKKAKKAKTEQPAEKPPINAVQVSELSKDSKALKAVEYLKTILDSLGCENIEFKVAEKENGALILLEGEGLGVIIGRRGETLDALQHLSSLVCRDGNGYYKVTLNIGNYREKREDTLISLANRVAANVIKNGKGKALEPMNPYERRIIHTAVQSIEGVTSSSVGEGENRRVVIVLEGQSVNDVRFDRPRRDRGGRYDRRRNRGHQSNRVESPAREPRSDSNAFPLYGKIEPKSED